MSIMDMDKAYVAGTYKRFPVEIVSGKGSHAVDSQGKTYVDMGSGIGVTAFGYGDEAWKAAVCAQLDKVQHTSNLYYNAPCARLAKLLCEKTGMKKVFFSNSGAEANECAIKAARKYSAEKKGADCYTIVTLQNSFHGRTLTTLAATGQDHFHQLYQPLTPGFVHVPANDIQALKDCVAKVKVAGILMEVVQGEGGVLPLTAEYLAAANKLAHEQDIPLMMDEVQIGNGRSGKLYGYMNFDVQPDIVSTAKGLGGGLPIGATMFGEKTQDVFTYGTHGSTFGGNPIACAGAVSILKEIDDALLASVKEKGDYIKKEMEGAKGVKSVAGMGLMLGIEPVAPVGPIVEKLLAKGVVVLTAKEKIRLLPALNIPMEQLKKAVAIMKDVLAEE